MAALFLASLAALIIVFFVVMRSAAREWRQGRDLSRATALAISSVYVLLGLALATAVAWRPWPLELPAGVAWGIAAVLALTGGLLTAAGISRFRSLPELYGVDHAGLITGGVYRLSRNPQYVGIGLLALAAAAAGRSGLGLVLALAYWPAIRVWLALEERHLEAEHGAAYRAYRDATPRFLVR